MAEPEQLIALSKEICTLLVHAFGNGALTASGAQYGTSGNATSTDTWLEVDNKLISLFDANGLEKGFGYPADILEVEFGLTCNVNKSSTGSSTGSVIYAWQARNASMTSSTDTWVWLTPTSSGNDTAIGSTGVDSTLAGYFATTTYFDKVPFRVRLLVKAGTKGDSTGGDSSTGAFAKAKNSSYIKVLYRVV